MEVNQLTLMAVANSFTHAANAGHVISGVLGMFPNIWAGAIFAGQTFGGSQFASGLGALAKALESSAAEANYFANLAGTIGGYERRQDEWVHQSKLALAELKQIQKQIIAAEIRRDIAQHELDNHDTQIENAQEVDDFMRSKFTNQQLYGWMSSKIAEVYFRTYQLALDQARRAERAYQHELGLDNTAAPFVKNDNWDSLKRGLLAGDHLHHDLKRMESAYLERNVREFELTKHISLLQLNPGALIALKESDTNSCEFDLPEVLFDLDCPGHYMRRIKSVSLSIPCVVGPYASVNATLQLTRNEIRTKNDMTKTYKRQPDDSRFMAAAATITAIVTSSAQQDSGMFEQNLRDERYLPFEGAGAISSWRLELPSEFHAFDYETIADVILHVRYTARDGGSDLENACVAGLAENLNFITQAADKTGLARLFSLRQEFPSEWYRLTNGTGAGSTRSQDFILTKNRFPFLFSNKNTTLTISSVDLYALPKANAADPKFPNTLKLYLPKAATEVTGEAAPVGLLPGKTYPPKGTDTKVTVTESDDAATWKLEIPETDVPQLRDNFADILMICHYSVSNNRT